MNPTRERPILFSAPMVRAILEGLKTQTRRVVKHRITGPNPPSRFFDWHHQKTGVWLGAHGGGMDFSKTNAALLCPYGQPGDRLWVRETWRALKRFDSHKPRDIQDSIVAFEADTNAGDLLAAPVGRMGKLRQSIFMPRWASRITLEITGVRVERLQDISETDALDEGITYNEISNNGLDPMRARTWYRGLWESINGPGSWDANPFCWVVEFKQYGHEPNP